MEDFTNLIPMLFHARNIEKLRSDALGLRQGRLGNRPVGARHAVSLHEHEAFRYELTISVRIGIVYCQPGNCGRDSCCIRPVARWSGLIPYKCWFTRVPRLGVVRPVRMEGETISPSKPPPS